MRLKDITEGYDPEHECKTPDAIFSSHIEDDEVSMSVKLPFKLDLTKEEADDLEAEIHYAFEKVLSKYF
jgi:hypothetical protein